MLLAVDIGNTHTVVGVFEDDVLKSNWRVTTSPDATEDELWVMLHALLEEGDVPPQELEAVIVASVVPALTDAMESACDTYLDIKPLFVSSELDLGIQVNVRPPESVGADRLANAVAARHEYGIPAVVVDMGTATTFDVIDGEGAYMGGVIAPGVLTSSEELFRRAARLAKVDIQVPERVIGDTTEASLCSGLYLGTLSMVDGLVEQIACELGTTPAIVFTGGLSTPFREAFADRGEVDPLLTLKGLLLIYRRTC
jgi:type III pantothenate kinase